MDSDHIEDGKPQRPGPVRRFLGTLDCGFHRRGRRANHSPQNQSPNLSRLEINQTLSSNKSNRNSSQVARAPRDFSWSDGHQSIRLDTDPAVGQEQDSDLESIVDAVTGSRINALVEAARDRGTIQQPVFGDNDFVDISQELADQGKSEWSLRPRIYTLLWLLGRQEEMEQFVGFVDADLPFSLSTIRGKLGAGVSKSELYDFQSALLSPMMALEQPGSAHLQVDGLARNYFNTLLILGRGRHAHVEKVQSRFTLKIYALKRLPSDPTAGSSNSTLVNEISILRKLRHRHLVQFVASFTDYKSVALLMSPVADMDLGGLFEKVHGLYLNRDDDASREKFDDFCKTLKTFYGCLANALTYLHRNNVRHKDIKPANILVKDREVYLSDFALARRWNDDSVSRGDVGEYTPKYAAPEVVNETPRNSSSDVWSLGCVFLEIATVTTGRSVTEISDCMQQLGTKERPYSSNIEGMNLYIEKLSNSMENPNDRIPLDWITMMTTLFKNFEERPSASDIFRTIATSDPALTFVGQCCAVDDVESWHSQSFQGNRGLLAASQTVQSPPRGPVPDRSPRMNIEDGFSSSFDKEIGSPMARTSSNTEDRRRSMRSTVSRTPTGTSIVVPVGISTPSIRIIEPLDSIKRTDSPESFTTAPGRFGKTTKQKSKELTVPWDSFFDVQELPEAEHGFTANEGELPPPRFVDADTVAKTKSVLAAHFNRIEKSSATKQELRSNPILDMPKICCILHLMDRHDLLSTFIRTGKTDDDLPALIGPELHEMLPADAAEYFEIAYHQIHVRDFHPDDISIYGANELLPIKSKGPLGKGGWATVDKVENIFPPFKMMARKVFAATSLSSADGVKFRLSFKKEIANLRKLSGHQHIVQLEHAYETPTTLGLLLSPVANCDLSKYLRLWEHYGRQPQTRHWNCGEILRRSFGCLASGLAFIHRHSIRYKDVKPENILLVSEAKTGVKFLFTDFGISYDFSQATKSVTQGPNLAGSERYYAPEAAKKYRRRGRKQDIFSLGCVFLEIATVLAGRKVQELWDHLDDGYIYWTSLENCKTWIKTLEEDDKCPAEVKGALKWVAQMIEFDMEDRPDADSLVLRIAEDTQKISARPTFFCDFCRGELGNVTVQKNRDDDYDSLRGEDQDVTEEFDDVVLEHMREVLVSCLRGMLCLCTTLSLSLDMSYLKIRLKFELLRLVSCSTVVGLWPQTARPTPDLQSNHIAILNTLTQQKTLLQGIFGIDLDSNRSGDPAGADCSGDDDPTPPSLSASMTEAFDRLPRSSSCLLEHLFDDSLLKMGSIVTTTDDGKITATGNLDLEQLVSHLSQKNTDFRRVLSPETNTLIQEKDEENSLGLLELCDNPDQLRALVTAVLPDLLKSPDGWEIQDAFRRKPESRPGLWSRQTLAVFARFKAINISSARDSAVRRLEINEEQLGIPPGTFSNSHLRAQYEYPVRDITYLRTERQILIPVWVEWKEFEDWDIDNSFELIRELAALLSDRDKPREFRVPTCAGYFRENPQGTRFGLVFETDPTTSAEPVSLNSLFTELATPSEPERLALAHALSRSVLYLHAVRWLHKGLSSYAAIFFRNKSGRVDFGSPFLSSFDYSRPDASDELTQKPRFHPKLDFYRHPYAQGQSALKFRREWDIYSLGVVLIEIARWEPIDEILGRSGQTQGGAERYEGRPARTAREQLLHDDTLFDGLPDCFRDSYEQVVLNCLTGSEAFGLQHGEDEKNPIVAERLQVSFYNVAIKELERLSRNYRLAPERKSKSNTSNRSFEYLI